jgi:hypothetical protein
LTWIAGLGGVLGILLLGQVVHAQQFGPSQQSLYHQHPGDAPTFTNYGAPTLTPKVSDTPQRKRADSTGRSQAEKSVPATRQRPVQRSGSSMGSREAQPIHLGN